jgi:Lhr-like helicase
MRGGARSGRLHNHQDSEDPVSGGLDVLAQHILGTACADAFDPVELHAEIRRAWPYRELSSWEQFERTVDFVATGGYALRAYERYAQVEARPATASFAFPIRRWPSSTASTSAPSLRSRW